ncbi:MAG: hypothetical protein AABW88_05290 [Nanoarchaeota archaeon]
MKNTVLSVVLAFLVLMVSASATCSTNTVSKVCVNSTSPEIYFSGDGNEVFTSLNVAVQSEGFLSIYNRLASTPASINFASTTLRHVFDSDSKINITRPSNQNIVNRTSLSLELLIESIKDIEAGEYTGTLEIINASNSNPATLLFDTISVKVLVPAVEITSISIKDKETGLSDSKLEKGQKFTVTVEYKNIADQTDLENVNINVGIYEGDETDLNTLVVDSDEDDLETDDDVSDLGNGKTGSVSFDFEMPFTVEDKDKFTILAEITADAQDTSSKFYAKDVKEFTSTVPDDRIEITKALFVPSTLACGVNKAKMHVELKNIGSNQQDVQVFLRNSVGSDVANLNGGDDVQVDNNYDNEEDYTQTVEEYVTLKELKAGENAYSIIGYYNDGDLTVQQDVKVTSESCTPVPVTSPTQTPTQPVLNPDNNVVVIPTTTSTPIVPTSNPSYVTLKDISGFGLDSDLILPVAIGVGGLIVGVIVAMVLIPRP